MRKYLLGLLVVGAMAPMAQAEVIYRELWTQTNAAPYPTASASGWHEWANTGADYTNTQPFNNNATGGTSAGPAIRSYPTLSASDPGRVSVQNPSGQIKATLVWTDEFTTGAEAITDVLLSDVSEIGWWQSGRGTLVGGGAPYNLRLVVQDTAGNWYISNNNFTTTSVGGTFGDVALWESSGPLSAVQWNTLTVNSPTDFTVGALINGGTGTLPGGLILKAAGVYNGGNQDIGIDTFQITTSAAAVPEPSTIALLASGVTLLVGRRRRSR